MVIEKIVAQGQEPCPLCNDVMFIPIINNTRGFYLDQNCSKNIVITHEKCPVCNDFNYPISKNNENIIW